MMWVLGVVAMALVASGFFLASGRLGRMPEPVDPRVAPRLPRGRFESADVRRLRFPSVAFGGYAPNEVDNLFDQIAHELDEQDRAAAVELARAAHFRVQRFGYQASVVDDVLDLLVAREQSSDQTVADVATAAEPAQSLE